MTYTPKTATLFTPGQRWVSETEPELGMGILTGLDNRSLTLLFPPWTAPEVTAGPGPPSGGSGSNPGT